MIYWSLHGSRRRPETLLSGQSHKLPAAPVVNSDLSFAYELQLQEAMAASLAENGGGPSSSNPFEEDYDRLIANEISSYEQQLQDQLVAEAEMKKIREDLNRSIHDHAPLPGRYLICRKMVHVKGSMGNMNGNGKHDAYVGGIGVAVCDMNDLLIFEVRKRVVGGEMSIEVVKVKALIEGLHVATMLGLKRILIICDSQLIHQCFTGKWHPREGNLGRLFSQLTILLRNLPRCKLCLVATKRLKFAAKLAQDAIVSQPGKHVGGKKPIETCYLFGRH
ncbi:OLC1v1004083C1 [Oldenlandia corymbosa var. corymbosa]|uniref:OLC1v1004083C1 n=1 Tax=Oldenlandia corymbosa var. corymbosa TaxID=529605 RepID=A0AAV1DDW3_OLDCO|nr:OLC1v1004083C1 [Oldenlandia corymbosa var. corymbosa]